MAKAPRNLPELHDRVRMRGKNLFGVIKFINPENNWARVVWDHGCDGPIVCHIYELEKE